MKKKFTTHYDPVETVKPSNRDRMINNPNNEPVGHFTGRCKECGSNDLWDDNLSYGCNKCGAMWICNC